MRQYSHRFRLRMSSYASHKLKIQIRGGRLMSLRREVPSGREVFIPAASGGAFEAKSGEFITVIDVEGQQIGDFVVLNSADHAESLSTAITRTILASIYVREGDKLYTNLRRPIIEIIEDKVGCHDILMAACDSIRYEQVGLIGHRNCLDNLCGALKKYGVQRSQVPEPFNIFENTPVDAGGKITIQAPLSKSGDRIVLRALMDLIGAVSACAQDQNAANGYKLTPLRVVISSSRP